MENTDLFLRTSNNIKTILSRYSVAIMHNIVFETFSPEPSAIDYRINIGWDLTLLMLLLLVFFFTMFQNERNTWYHGSDASIAFIHQWRSYKFAYSTEQTGKNTQPVSKQERLMIFPRDVNSGPLIVSKQHYLILKGCIIWYGKHFSSYQARAMKLVYHTQGKQKWEDQMAEPPAIL